MKKSLMLGVVIILSLFVMGNVNAELYFDVPLSSYGISEDTSDLIFDSNFPIWSATLSTNNGKELKISLVNTSWKSEEWDSNYIFVNRGNGYKEGDLVAFSGGNGEGPIVGEVGTVTSEGGIWNMRWIFFVRTDEFGNSIYSGAFDKENIEEGIMSFENLKNFGVNNIKKIYLGYKIGDSLRAINSNGNGNGAEIRVKYVYEDGSFSGIDTEGNYLREEHSFTLVNNQIVTYLDNGTNQYLSYFPFIEEDVKEKGTFWSWGCFKGGTFSDSFKSIFSIILGGGNPFPESSKVPDKTYPEFLTDSDAENTFEDETRKIINTPGTGIYNYSQCSKLCDEEIEKEQKLQWENTNCFFGVYSCNRSIKTRLNDNECKKQCVLTDNCGAYDEHQSYDSYGLPGIKSLKINIYPKEMNKEIYNIILNIDPSTGKIAKKSTVNGKPVTVLNEAGDIYLARLLAFNYVE